MASLDTGLRSILSGLEMLERSGLIRFSLEVRPLDPIDPSAPWHLRDKARTQAVLRLANGRSAVLDVHDSWEIDGEALRAHDWYFKRSLRADSVLMPGGERLRALGLLNSVHLDGFSRHELRYVCHPLHGESWTAARLKGGVRAARGMARVLGNRVGLGNRLAVEQLRPQPESLEEPRVLLMAGLWDPNDVPASCPEKRIEFEAINEMRVQCVRALRRAFGSRFSGGIAPTAFAQARCPDALLPSMAAAGHRRFIDQARVHAICVTSMGLHGSNGFRFAELLSLSRAIVSEPLRYVVPGPLAAGAHYLPYRNPAECVQRVETLMASEAARRQMTQINADYYEQWLRPDRLVWRMLRTLQDGASRPVRASPSAALSAPADMRSAETRTSAGVMQRDHSARAI